jgi:hypothetical protein
VDYPRLERACIVLSLVATMVMTWQVLWETLVPSA